MILTISVIALIFGVALYLISKKRAEPTSEKKSSPEVIDDVIVFQDYPEENPPAQMDEKSRDINFLESNFEIEQLYDIQENQASDPIKGDSPDPLKSTEEPPAVNKEEKIKPATKKYKSAKKDPKKSKGAKRGRKPKPKDDILLHS